MREPNPYAMSFLRGPLGVVLLIGFFWYPPTPSIWAAVAKVVLLVLAGGLMIYHASGAGPYGRLKRLRRELPWFRLQPVTCHALAAEPALPATLARNGYTTIELDGTAIRSPSDLATALQSAFGAMRFPSDPAAKCASILMRAAGQRPRRRALIWRHAAESLRHDPGLVVEFAAMWLAMAPTLPTGLLVFVDLPGATTPGDEAAPATLQRIGADAPEPDMAALTAAPRGAWWKPRPGELAK